MAKNVDRLSLEERQAIGQQAAAMLHRLDQL
jgi:hypothetical protein